MKKGDIIMSEVRARRYLLGEVLKENDRLPPEERATNTMTIVEEGDRMIIVDGSAQEMEDLFVRVFEERPEMRQVVESALHKRFRIATVRI